jgi:hypothetical protein
MDPVKEAFLKVRQDIDFLFIELQEIKRTLNEIKSQQSNQPTIQQIKPTNQHIIPSYNGPPTQYPTHILPLKAPKTQYIEVSTRNDGVPTNQPTIQQTNQHPIISYGNAGITREEGKISQLKRVSQIIESLDEIKKEVRIKFKQLTEQEMAIFTAIYQLEDQGLLVDYNLLAERFNLTEISIRDYIRKITKKGIEISKIKQNNKKIILSIPDDIKKIASLQTILQLRQL